MQTKTNKKLFKLILFQRFIHCTIDVLHCIAILIPETMVTLNSPEVCGRGPLITDIFLFLASKRVQETLCTRWKVGVVLPESPTREDRSMISTLTRCD